MPHDATRADSPERWIEYARADMALAGAPLPEGARLEQLCFHAQQEAEKSLKAVLLYLGLEFPFTHSLQALIDLIPDGIVPLKEAAAAAGLTPYAVLSRYPGETEPVDEQEYAEALSAAAATMAWASSVIAAGQEALQDGETADDT